jgi:hypothetical protein
MKNRIKTPALLAVSCIALFDILLRRKQEIEFELLDSPPDPATWLERPNRAGWWLWKEAGNYARTELLLVGDGGTHIADDEEWDRVVGRSPSDAKGESENYWEGTKTSQRYMTGEWFYLSNAASEGRRSEA